MPQTETNWTKTVLAFFGSFPEREFYVGEIGPAELGEAAQAFWLVGFTLPTAEPGRVSSPGPSGRSGNGPGDRPPP